MQSRPSAGIGSRLGFPRCIREVRLQRGPWDGAVEVLDEVRAAPRGRASERGAAREPLGSNLRDVFLKPVGVRSVPRKLHHDLLLQNPALVQPTFHSF